MPRASSILLVVAACVPPPAAPTPSSGESYATVTTSEGPGPAPTVSAPPPDPWASAACPTDLSLSDGDRDIDGRMPLDTIHTRYAKEHLQEAKPKDFIDRDAAIEKILALETAKPGVVPAGFRDQLAEHGRDPHFRLYMARCELEKDITTRRAGYDAGLAFLLGATSEETLPIAEASFYPDGTTSQSCSSKSDCNDGMTCDRVEKSCRSKRYKTAHFMSATELDIEDILSRTFAGMLTPDMIKDSRYHADDLIGTFAYGRYTKCSRVLCTFTRYALESGTKLVHWDRRDHGETYSVPSDEPVTVEDKECFDRTQSSDLDQCKYRCSDGPSSKEADCLVRCAAWCK